VSGFWCFGSWVLWWVSVSGCWRGVGCWAVAGWSWVAGAGACGVLGAAGSGCAGLGVVSASLVLLAAAVWDSLLCWGFFGAGHAGPAVGGRAALMLLLGLSGLASAGRRVVWGGGAGVWGLLRWGLGLVRCVGGGGGCFCCWRAGVGGLGSAAVWSWCWGRLFGADGCLLVAVLGLLRLAS